MNPEEIRYEESKLVSLLAEGSEYAFQLIYDRHRKRIYQTALRYLKSPVIAQDVVQDVFLKLWYHRKSLNPNQPIEGWLYSIAKNNLLNRIKKIANEWNAMQDIAYVKDSLFDNPEIKLEESQHKELLALAISRLSDQQRTVWKMSRYEMLSYIEIGEKLEISPLTVKTHMSRALASIKVFFLQHGISLKCSLFLLFI
ncbi:MAG: RNA polymerase sigma-70 factor [Ginsengibacter sp.]